VVHRGRPVAAWAAVENRIVRGYVVRFEPPGEPERFLYSVRNQHQQDLGALNHRLVRPAQKRFELGLALKRLPERPEVQR